jgi:ribonuclease P protein component
VFGAASKSSDRYLTVLAKKNASSEPRLGFAVAKKVVRKAARRNNIRRVIRESFRLKKHVLAGYDFVVMCNRYAVLATNEELAVSIQQHWKKLTANE